LICGRGHLTAAHEWLASRLITFATGFSMSDLAAAVPFGRNFEEYCLMFMLTDEHKSSRILGVGDGPASFNAEASAQGWRVTSVDPLYEHSAEAIAGDSTKSLDQVVDRVFAGASSWTLSYHKSAESLRAKRFKSIEIFCDDYKHGLSTGRYVAGRLPRLPFLDDSYDVALCSNLLFLYSEMFDLSMHIHSVREMLRVAHTIQIFPLFALDRSISKHLGAVVEHFVAEGCSLSIQTVAYELQPGSNRKLTISRPNHPLSSFRK
jgi:hypothetical protein